MFGTVLLYDRASMEHDTPDRTPAHLIRELTDSDLVAKARTDDFFAFEELVRRYRNDVFRLAFHYVRNREEAWDISQEVFIKVHGALSGFRGEANVKTWMLRIAANQCKDFLKKRRLPTVSMEDVTPGADFASQTQNPSDVLAMQELGRAIEAALAHMPHKHRTAFILREYEGLSYEEMAHVMKCNLGTVMSRLHHARKKMQQSLIDMGIVEGSTHG